MATSETGGIIRAVKDRGHPYKLVNKGFAEDSRLSLEARGLLALELLTEATYRRDGVPLNDVTLADLRRVGAELGIDAAGLGEA